MKRRGFMAALAALAIMPKKLAALHRVRTKDSAVRAYNPSTGHVETLGKVTVPAFDRIEDAVFLLGEAETLKHVNQGVRIKAQAEARMRLMIRRRV